MYYNLTKSILLIIEAQLAPISVVVRQLFATLGGHVSVKLTPPLTKKNIKDYKCLYAYQTMRRRWVFQ
jgi:hypothetical protein